MKGSYGLIVAAVVGVLGAVLNWIYIQNQTRDAERISFLGLREGTTVSPGQSFRESDLVEVSIPKKYATALEGYAYLYSDKATVVDLSPTRTYDGAQLILREDLRTAPEEIAFTSSNQSMVTIRVDPSIFQSSLYKPGDKIDFLFPVTERRGGIIDGSSLNDQDEFEIVGPFTIAHIGGRLGSVGAAAAERSRPGQERTVGVFATWEGDGFDAQTRRLLSLDKRANGQQVRVVMHSRSGSR